MKVIIVEDEVTATKKLKSVLAKCDSSIEIATCLESVDATVRWLNMNAHPDLAFFDIQLSDATSFDIFEQIDIRFPVIFITAYDAYLMKALEHNSIHYLLKPITREKMAQALSKFDQLKAHFSSGITSQLNETKETVFSRKRLIVRKGMDYAPIEPEDVAYIFTEHKVSFVKEKSGAVSIIDESLANLEKTLDTSQFFRANRQYLVSIDAIKRFRSIDQSKISLELEPNPEEEVIIGKANASVFRKWIGGG